MMLNTLLETRPRAKAIAAQAVFAAALLASALILALASAPATRAQGFPAPVLNADATKQVSPHVWMITGFPNIAIVVGDRATLVVDTGLGPRNGATVAAEARKLSKPGARLYLTTTHFHPEHAAGDAGLPADTIVIRNAAQQKELDEQGMQMVDLFRSRDATIKELLADAKFRAPDVVYDREAKVDLGGATARLLWYGGAHTVGDELTFVEPDDVLVSGDVVQNKVSPNIAGGASTFKDWRATVEQVTKLPVKIVLPDHSAVGDASLVTQELAFLTDLETLTADAKRAGKSADDAAASVADARKQKYGDWTGINNLPNLVKRVYAEP